MCGIAGILSFDPEKRPIDEQTIVNMRDTMIHRGPDGAGTYINNNASLGFGHRRLAIIDLSESASQPMQLVDGSLTIVFNGEIYNHSDLRAELEALGHHSWQTDHSDTEMILHAFQEWGIDCVKRFNGMFAIAIWDENTEELWLIRDRIGIKPLYYALDNRGIVFASEIKAILAGPDRDRKVNEEAFFHYLSFLTTPAPMTLFEGINKLPGGTWANIKKTGEINFNTWWNPWDEAPLITNQSPENIANDVFSNLNNSIQLRKISDVPTGVFLSGGVDSSINIALFSDGEANAINAFSIGYPDDQKSIPDELPFARMMAESVRAKHHEYLITQEDLINFLPDMIRFQDEPIADPVCIPVYFVAKLAKNNGVTVCQVGEGADELFIGYPSWQTFLKLQQASSWPFPAGLKKFAIKILSLLGLGNRRYTEFLRRSGENLPIFWGGAEAFTEKGKQDILSTRLKDKFRGRSSWEIISPIFSDYNKNAPKNSTLNWMTYLDLKLRLPELLLMRVDKMTMAASLEARVPFLDHKVVEHALSIPSKQKINGGTLKYVLKEAFKHLLPSEIINRKKQGFAVPIDDWIFDKLGIEASTKLREFCHKTNFLDSNGVENILRRKNSRQIWYLLNFVLWWEEYIAPYRKAENEN